MNSVQISTNDVYGKRIIILAGVAIVLIALFIVGSIVQANNRRSVDIANISEYLSEDSNIVGITISADQEIELQSVASEWVVEYPDSIGRRARSSRVEEFIDTIRAINFTRRVSRSADDLSEFGLAENVQSISLFDDQNRIITELRFGNLATARSEQYFQVEGAPEVYAIETGVNFYLNQSELFWTDLRVWNDFESEIIAFFRTTDDGDREVWNKNPDGTWISAQDEAAQDEPDQNQSSAIENMVQTFQTLEGDRIVDSIPENAVPTLELGLVSADATEQSITVYSLVAEEPENPETEAAEAEYFIVASGTLATLSVAGETQIFSLPAWRYNGLINF